MKQPVLLTLDCGNTSLRATLFDSNGASLGTRSAELGVRKVQELGIQRAFSLFCEDWLCFRGLSVIANGIVGRDATQEPSYLSCPATALDAAANLAVVSEFDMQSLYIVPGVQCHSADGCIDLLSEAPKVWGSGLQTAGICILPGTHSKWVTLNEDGAIITLRTFITGELYASLIPQGVSAQLLSVAMPAPEAFRDGVRLGVRDCDRITNEIFHSSNYDFLKNVSSEAFPDFLSGLLLGAEIGVGRRQLLNSPRMSCSEITLIGDVGLCNRYELALALAGISSRRAPKDASARGLWMIAGLAELVNNTVTR
jgi:2-dehydro-3-deoxygalactonokinase